MNIKTGLLLPGRIHRACVAATAMLFLCAPVAPLAAEDATDPFPEPGAVLTPAALVREGLAHNQELLAGRAGERAARARVPQAAAFDEPMLEAGLVNAPLPSLSSRSEDMTMRMLGLSQKVSFPGKRSLRRSMAEADAQGVSLAREELAHRIARDVRVAAVKLQRLDALEPLLLATQSSLHALASLAEGRYVLGLAAQADVLAAQSALAGLDSELIGLREERTGTQAQLSQLLGRNTTGVGVAPLPADERIVVPAADELQAAGEQRPQLRALAAMGERESRGLELARRERYPDFELKLAYGQRQRAADGMQRADMITLTVAMNLPIFRDARQGPVIAEARAGAEQARAMLVVQQLQTQSEILQQLAAARAAGERLELARGTLAPQAVALYESRLAGYRAGQVGFDALLAARMRQLDVERTRLDARTQAITALAELALLAGAATEANGVAP